MNCFKSKKPYVPENANVFDPDYEHLTKITHFTRPELEDILKKYETVCDENGTLSKEVFQELVTATYCPLINFAFDHELDAISTVGESLVDFTSFVESLSVFSSRASGTEKKKFLFDLLKGSSHSTGITKKEFQKLFLYMVAGNVVQSNAEAVFQKIWVKVADSGDRVTFQHFCKLISDYDLRSFMTFDLC